ncbi:MAG: NAD(P)/FAD-dependent oxidoreductase [Clostridia bacterium]|nr:NAD(P)/FAD-dependent oxidoreductase [Clostridia bacterium]
MAKVLIIGGGVAGLSAGIYSELCGQHAVVCERHSAAGGNLTGWQRGEYHIDNCIHWLTGTNPSSDTYKTWEELGALGGIDIFQGDTLYTCEYRGETLSLCKNLKRLEESMLAVSPRDKDEIRSLIRAVRTMQGLCGIAGEEHDKKLSLSGKLSALPMLTKYYALTVSELASRFSHPLLRRFIGAFWGEDFGALALVTVFAAFCGENGGIPKGSSRAMAERMSSRLKALGGELLLGKEAVKINRLNGKAVSVDFADDTRIEADYIVVACDPAAVFGKLLDADMPRRLAKQYKDPRLHRFSSYQCALSCDTSALSFKGDFIFDVPRKYRSELRINQVIVREFSHEEAFAPRGKTVLQTLTFCYEDEARKFIELRDKDREAYERKKRSLADALVRILVMKFPQMKGKLELLDVWTPATYKRYTGSETGSYMSFVFPSKRLPVRIGNRVKGLSNVLLATQWQQMPGGLPIAAEAGKRAAETIAKTEAREGRRLFSQRKPYAERLGEI